MGGNEDKQAGRHRRRRFCRNQVKYSKRCAFNTLQFDDLCISAH